MDLKPVFFDYSGGVFKFIFVLSVINLNPFSTPQIR